MKTRKELHSICSGCGEGKAELDGMMFTASKVYCDACLKHPQAPHAVASTASHTPTPWKVSQAGENLYLYVDLPSDNWPVHNVIANVDDDMGNAKANAAFIVRAVNEYESLQRFRNAHEELLEVLKQLANVTNVKGMNRLVVASIVERAWQAIAKAEGSPDVWRAEGK